PPARRGARRRLTRLVRVQVVHDPVPAAARDQPTVHRHGEDEPAQPVRQRSMGGSSPGGGGAGRIARVITLYDAGRCPYCARARIALAEKGVEYETVTIDLSNRPG